MSDTPRTEDAKFSGIHAHPDEEYVDADFARELERENARLEHFLSGEKIARQYAIDQGVEIQRENTRLRAALYVIGYDTLPPCFDDPADIAQTTLTQSADYSSFRPLPNVH